MSAHPLALLASDVPPAGDGGALSRLDDALHERWRLGRNVVLAWCEAGSAVDVLAVPNYLPAEALSAQGAGEGRGAGAAGERARAVLDLINGHKRVDSARMRALEVLLGQKRHRITLPARPGALPGQRVEELIRRYSISRFEDRAVVLFDIVGFSLLEPLAQLTQLNSLAYSINAAHDRLRQRVPNVDITRTTTGDGFYVWNRLSGIEANINLYHLMHLVLADNAIARGKSRRGLVPAVKTAYHIGDHYEFYQNEALRPTAYSYIVGDVTIQLARIMDGALPEQVIVGDFNVLMPLRDDCLQRVRLDAAAFIDRLQDSLNTLRGLTLSGERVMSIKCYLTGPRNAAGGYDIARHRFTDKHGRKFTAYNAKINIFRENGPPIFLGLQESELARTR
jgi:hypothetical protein